MPDGVRTMKHTAPVSFILPLAGLAD